MTDLKPGERILEYLRKQPVEFFSSRELSIALDIPRNTVRRNVLRLADADIINMKLGRDKRTGNEAFVYSYNG